MNKLITSQNALLSLSKNTAKLDRPRVKIPHTTMVAMTTMAAAILQHVTVTCTRRVWDSEVVPTNENGASQKRFPGIIKLPVSCCFVFRKTGNRERGGCRRNSGSCVSPGERNVM